MGWLPCGGSRRSSGRLILRTVLSVLILLLFLLVLFRFVPLSELAAGLALLEGNAVLLSFILYGFSQLGRALRWKLLLRSMSLKDLFLVNTANIFFNNILPARTGELSWFYYTRKLGLRLEVSLWTFLMGRFYDLFSLSALFLISYALVRNPLLVAPSLLFVLLLSLLLPYGRVLIPGWGRLGDLRDFRELTPSLSLRLTLISLLSLFLKAMAVYVLISSMLAVNLFLFTFGFGA